MYTCVYVYCIYFSLFGVIIVHSAFNFVISPNNKLDYKSLSKSKELFHL